MNGLKNMDNKNLDSTTHLVPSLVRFHQIMNIISLSDQRVTVSNLSRKTGIPKSTMYGLCVTLVELELLQKREDQSLRIGPHVMRWANAFSRNADVTDEFHAIWDAESDFPGATITLSVRDNVDVVYIAARNSDHYPEFFNFNIGSRLPAAFTATGKAFLMALSDREIERMFKDAFPTPLTENSVRDIPQLLAELRKYRKKGYAIDDEQVKEGMRCFGRTVLNAQNIAIAGIAVSVPAEPISKNEENKIVRSLNSFAVKISRQLGADPLALELKKPS